MFNPVEKSKSSPEISLCNHKFLNALEYWSIVLDTDFLCDNRKIPINKNSFQFLINVIKQKYFQKRTRNITFVNSAKCFFQSNNKRALYYLHYNTSKIFFSVLQLSQLRIRNLLLVSIFQFFFFNIYNICNAQFLCDPNKISLWFRSMRRALLSYHFNNSHYGALCTENIRRVI